MKLVNMGRASVLPMLLAAAAGCSDMDPAQDTFETVYGPLQTAGAGSGPSEGGSGGTAGSGGSGGTAAASDLPPEWQCLANPSALPTYMPPNPAPGTVNYLVPIVDFDAKNAVEGLDVKLCNSSSCNPSITIPPVVRPNPAQPVYLVVVPFTRDDFYLEITAPGYATMDYYFGGPVIGSSRTPFIGYPIPMLRLETLDKLLVDIMAPSPSPDGRGVLAVRTLDCEGQRAPSVVVEAVSSIPEDSVGWTLSDNNVALGGVLATSDRGVAGFANVPEGAYRVQGVVPVDDGIPYGGHTLRVKPGAITLGEVRFGIGQYGQ